MEPTGYGSVSGAIGELHRIGAVEGVHYRLSKPGEDIKDFIIAIDNGPMVVTMKGGFEVAPVNGPLETFAILNADGMQLVGAGMTAVQMRNGKVPPEAAYVLAVQ